MVIALGASAASAKMPIQPPTTDDPSHGGSDRAWTVVVPPLFPPHGPAVPRLHHCTAAKVTAHATTRTIPGGVAGLVRLKGDHCSIFSDAGPDELRGGDTTLDVDTTPWSTQTDPLDTGRSDIPRDYGDLIWSFTWTGSWCGSNATAIVVPLVKDGGDVMAPLKGPEPGCHANPGNVRSVLLPGAPAAPGVPDMRPGADWSGLTAGLSMPKVLHSTKIRHLVVTFTNSTDADIPLAPCPTYAIGAGGKRGSGTAKGFGHSLPCPYEPRVVPANGHVHVHLPNSAFFRGAVPNRGGRLTVTFEILGVPPAIAHAHVTRSAR
jgi:hypothetical protein